MYAGLALAYLGAALLIGAWWPLIALPPVLLAVLWLVIQPEERYLVERYGKTYTDYLGRVRPWL
jgi:protein-S-isoprenylcysteine O-methyltransferase Ste14